MSVAKTTTKLEPAPTATGGGQGEVWPVLDVASGKADRMSRDYLPVQARFLEREGFKLYDVAEWAARQKLLGVKRIYARVVGETAKAVRLEVVWQHAGVERRDIKAWEEGLERDQKLYVLDKFAEDKDMYGHPLEWRWLIITREVWMPRSAVVEVKA